MSDDTDTDLSNLAEPDDVEPGEPVEVLAALGQTPTRGFLSRIQGRIQRRHLAVDTADFALAGLAVVALAFLTALVQAFAPSDHTGGDK